MPVPVLAAPVVEDLESRRRYSLSAAERNAGGGRANTASMSEFWLVFSTAFRSVELVGVGGGRGRGILGNRERQMARTGTERNEIRLCQVLLREQQTGSFSQAAAVRWTAFFGQLGPFRGRATSESWSCGGSRGVVLLL